jgi:hypothetical protein
LKEGILMPIDLSEIFQRLKKLLKEYQPPLVAKSDYAWRYDLWTNKEATIAGRKRKEVFFGALIIQRDYVGFYYMPVYAKAEIKKVFKKELLSTLKGKSCFHIKELDGTLEKQIREALQIGFRYYKQRGWV